MLPSVSGIVTASSSSFLNVSVYGQLHSSTHQNELIKGKVRQNAMMDAGEAAEILAKALKADIVNVMGSTFVLFKRNPQNIKINIPTKRNPNPKA